MEPVTFFLSDINAEKTCHILEDIQVKHPYFNRMIVSPGKGWALPHLERKWEGFWSSRGTRFWNCHPSRQKTPQFKQPDKFTNRIVKHIACWDFFFLVDDRSLLVLHSTSIIRSNFSHAEIFKFNCLIMQKGMIWYHLYFPRKTKQHKDTLL